MPSAHHTARAASSPAPAQATGDAAERRPLPEAHSATAGAAGPGVRLASPGEAGGARREGWPVAPPWAGAPSGRAPPRPTGDAGERGPRPEPHGAPATTARRATPTSTKTARPGVVAP